MRIGIDVGRTNTDGVVLERDRVVGVVKLPTPRNVSSVFTAVIAALRARTGLNLSDVSAVMIGTPQFTDAIAEARGLLPTAVIRFAIPARRGLLPLAGWPRPLADALGQHHFVLRGGYAPDGREIGPFPTSDFLRVLQQIDAAGVRAVALSSASITGNPGFEQEAARLIERHLPHLLVTQAHEVGHVGLIGRENATVLNACLRTLADDVVTRVGDELADAGIAAPVFFSQNDGTVMDSEYTRRFPIATLSSGIANSIRGAGFLAGCTDGLVVDVGNSVTCVGALRGGYPRTTVDTVRVMGVNTNSRTPAVVSVSMGGGFAVETADPGLRFTRDIRPTPQVLGGSGLTVTDLAVRCGVTALGAAGRLPEIDEHHATKVLAGARQRISVAIEGVRDEERGGPVIAVGGAGFLVPDRPAGVRDTVIRPAEFAAAAAVGAATAQVGEHVDRIFDNRGRDIDTLIELACHEATERAIAAGAAAESVTMVDVDVSPLQHMPLAMTRISVHAVGEISSRAGRR